MILNNIINELIEKYHLYSLEVTSNPRELIVMLLSQIKDTSIANIKLSMVDINTKDIIILEQMLDKISNENIPPQYVIGNEYIYGNKFVINESVLIPRQDTETLIEYAIKTIKTNQYTTLLDLCTGSGVIGISIALNTNIKDVTLSDFSSKALQVAKNNILNLGVQNICHTVESDMFTNLYKLNNKYDIIVSNPPYLTKEEMNKISKFVQKEPVTALYGGNDGLEFYRIIFEEARNFLNNNGIIAVEIGCCQADDVVNIISKYAEYSDIRVVQDINNKNRVVVCHFQNK